MTFPFSTLAILPIRVNSEESLLASQPWHTVLAELRPCEEPRTLLVFIHGYAE